MPLYEPIVPARYCVLLIDFLQSMQPRGLEEVLTAAGLDEAGMRDPNAVLTLVQFDMLVAAFRVHTGRTDLGFELGRRITVDKHAALGWALRQCATLDAGLRLIARYFRLITPSFFLRYERHADHAELIYRPAALMSPEALHVLMEINAGSFHTQVAAALGARLAPYDLYLSMEPPPHLARYAGLRPARCHFGLTPLPEVRAVVSAKLLDLPLLPAHYQPRRYPGDEAVGPDVDEAKAARWRDWVVLMLREADGCQPSLEELAAMVSISPRTLIRHLAASNRSFRGLSNEVRHQRACAMLESADPPVSQIAYRLGYGDAANFSHAFRARSGVSPRAYRQARAKTARAA